MAAQYIGVDRQELRTLLRERDSRIAELERLLSAEKEHRSALQAAVVRGDMERNRLHAEANRLRSELAFLKPLFTDFEKLASALADEQVEGVPPALVRWAQRIVVMTPERMKRYGHTMTVEQPRRAK